MKRFVAFALFSVAAGCAAPATTLTATHRKAIVDSVQAALDQWRGALAAKDFARASHFYSADSTFRWYEDGELRYHSAAEIASAMQQMSPAFRTFELTLTDLRITPVAPGAAFVSTEFTQKMTDTLGTVGGYAGAISMMMVHGDSGWQFLAGHTSSIIPPIDSGRAPASGRGGRGTHT